MAQLLKNNVSGILSTQLNSASTSMMLVDASNFPTPTGGNFYLLTLVGLNTNGQEATWEVVKVTAKAANTLTVVRAQEGTTAATWSVASTVQLRLTAGTVATQDALVSGLATKEPTIAAGTTAQYRRGDNTWQTLDKTAAGLANVDNTSDVNKPVSTATQTALDAKVAASGGTASGLVLNDGYTEEIFAVTGTTPALSPSNGSIQTWTLTANSTLTAGTWANGQSITLMIDDGSGFTITWTSLDVVWKTNSGSAPTLQTTGFTVIQLWKVGNVIHGARVGDA